MLLSRDLPHHLRSIILHTAAWWHQAHSCLMTICKYYYWPERERTGSRRNQQQHTRQIIVWTPFWSESRDRRPCWGICSLYTLIIRNNRTQVTPTGYDARFLWLIIRVPPPYNNKPYKIGSPPQWTCSKESCSLSCRYLHSTAQGPVQCGAFKLVAGCLVEVLCSTLNNGDLTSALWFLTGPRWRQSPSGFHIHVTFRSI